MLKNIYVKNNISKKWGEKRIILKTLFNVKLLEIFPLRGAGGL
jgi:hypothetical protein